MTRRSRIHLAAAVASSALVAGSAWGNPVLIRPPSLEQGTGVTGISVQHPMGQSFIATGDSVHTVDLLLLNLNMSFELSQDRFVTLDLFEGIGFDGRHLTKGTVDVDQVLGKLVGTQGHVTFVLDIPVAPGQAYSFQLSALTPRYGTVWFSGNPYADGRAILMNQPFDDPDLYFGISAVPEPRSGVLLAAGLLLIVATAMPKRGAPLNTLGRQQ